MYPTINDRILRTRDYYCHFVPAENPKFVIALAFLGHHIPCIVIIICYVIVFIEIRKLFKTRPQDKAAAAASKAKAKTRISNSVAPTIANDSALSTAAVQLTPSTSKDPVTGHDERSFEAMGDNKSKNTETTLTAASDDNRKLDQKEKKNVQPQQPEKQQQKRQAAAPGAHAMTADAKARADRERKSFVTLSYIVIGYVVCWVPFHFVYDVSFIRPELISDDLYTATFWLTYVNSGINPFLYAFSSADLRSAVVKMLKCHCTSK